MKYKPLHEKIEFATVKDLVEWAGTQHKDKIAYSFKDGKDRKEVSFERLRRDVRGLATRLLNMGVAGKHCVLVGKLSYEWAITYFSVMAAGGVLVPLDRDWTAEDLADTAKNADASFVFCENELLCKAEVISESVELAYPVI